MEGGWKEEEVERCCDGVGDGCMGERAEAGMQKGIMSFAK